MFCQKCGTEGTEGNFCQKCGSKLEMTVQTQEKMIQQPVFQQQEQSKPPSDFSQYSAYYQRAFAIIEESNEEKSGGFNWAAFFFGCFWALFKGAWLSAIVAGVLVCFTQGICFPIFWILYGFRANRIMYNVKVKKKQVIC